MKTLKAKVSFSSLAVSASPGQEFSCSDEQAKDLVSAGYAEHATAAVSRPKKEKAVIKNESKRDNN